MKNKVTKKAYGKVNLFLSVGALRSDGKHEVENVMCRVGIYDTVTVEKAESGIELDCMGISFANEENLAYIAAKMYSERFGVSEGVKITVDKRIPVKAGMAGGSTDGAAVLLAMNELFGKAELDGLVQIASEMGADVPFFLYKEDIMLARGTGTELSSLPSLPSEIYGLFVTHGEKQSTGAMFSLLDSTREASFEFKTANRITNALEKGALSEILDEMYNDFENCTEHFGEVKKALLDSGAKRVLLSGSGPTVFGVFESEIAARAAASVLSYPSFTAKIGI